MTEVATTNGVHAPTKKTGRATRYSDAEKHAYVVRFRTRPKDQPAGEFIKQMGVSSAGIYTWNNDPKFASDDAPRATKALVKATSKALTAPPKRKGRRRRYSEDFKRRTILTFHNRPHGMQIGEFADKVGVARGLLKEWRDEYPPTGADLKAAKPPTGKRRGRPPGKALAAQAGASLVPADIAKELARLQKVNVILRAIATFAIEEGTLELFDLPFKREG